MIHRGSVKWTVLVILGAAASLLLAGCENVLGEDDDTPGTETPTVATDGSLTVGVTGVDMDVESTTEGDDDLLFAAFVFNAGGDPLSAEDSEENWVAMVAEEIVNGSASGTAFQIVEGERGAEWVGTAGESYDVYCTVYRVTLQDGPPLKDGEHFTLSNPECVHGTIDWQSPVTYEQDGDETLASSFDEYLETAQIEFAAQGALGLIGEVMDNIPEGGPTEETFAIVDGITGRLIQVDETETTLQALLQIDIDGYVFTGTELTPAPTAAGRIELTVVAPMVEGEPGEPVALAFTTTNLVLSQDDSSVPIEMDGTATDMGDAGPETFTGTFTIDGAEHDLAILTDMYNVP
jgi:hypothetical protein